MPDAIVHQVARVEYTIPETVGVKLGYIIGALVGDGCYSTQRNYPVELTVGCADVDLVYHYRACCDEVFGSPFKLYDYTRRGVYRVAVHSKKIREFLFWCGLDYARSWEKSVPWVIAEGPEAVQVQFLRGLFDADGGVSKSVVHYTTTSPMLVSGVHTMLANMGIVSSICPLGGRGGHRDAYRLHITGHGARTFRRRVGFQSARKTDALNRRHGRNISLWPKSNIGAVPGGSRLIDALRNAGGFDYVDGKRSSALVQRIVRGKSLLRFYHLEYICGLMNDVGRRTDAGKMLLRMHNDGLLVDEIVAKTQTG